MAAQDIQLDDGMDLVIGPAGDFIVSDSEQAHLQLIMVSCKGDWRQTPLQGVNIRQYLNAPMSSTIQVELASRIRLQLEYDNWQVIRVDVTDLANISVNAQRIQ